MRARVWGCRGSLAAPGANTVRYGGNTSCIEVQLDSGHTLVAELTEGRRRLVVLEDAMAGVVLVKYHPNRSVKCGCKPMPCHLRGRDGIADVVLERITCFAGNR